MSYHPKCDDCSKYHDGYADCPKPTTNRDVPVSDAMLIAGGKAVDGRFGTYGDLEAIYRAMHALTIQADTVDHCGIVEVDERDFTPGIDDGLVERLHSIANLIVRQAACLEAYAEQSGHPAKPIPSVFHSQATHFRDLADALRDTLQVQRTTRPVDLKAQESRARVSALADYLEENGNSDFAIGGRRVFVDDLRGLLS